MRLSHDGSFWRAADAGSTNGTWHNGSRVSEVVVNGEVRLRLAADGPEVLLSPQVPAPVGAPSAPPAPAVSAATAATGAAGTTGAQPYFATVKSAPVQANGSAAPPGAGGGPVLTGVHRVGGGVLRIGRAPTTTWSSTSWWSPAGTPSCARGPTGYEIVDLGSHNGTYLNGRPVTGPPIDPRRHRRHRPLRVLPRRRRTPGVRRHRRGLTRTCRTSRSTGRQGPQDAAGPGVLPGGREVPAGRRRPERRGQVDAAQRADRAAPRGPGHGPLRRPRPLPRLRRAAPAHRPRTAGRHPALAADRAPGARLRRANCASPRTPPRRSGRRGSTR